VNLLTTTNLELSTPLDDYLAQHRTMTAVETFSRRHESDLLHDQEPFYRALLPTSTPGVGEQYGFSVSLDACTGCKACVTACHSLNGLDDGESWRSVTLLRGGLNGVAHQQTVTAACHHCVDPACMRGCPVDAYEKDPITGIVSHLDDQCIGCTYCTLACPYEVPVYNHDRGIVRKCDMCKGRLETGEAPACVQGCPNGAISIALVSIAEVRTQAMTQGSSVVPGAPSSSITIPTSSYTSRFPERLAELGAVRANSDSGPSAPHTPLAVTLVLTQVAVGGFVIDALLGLKSGLMVSASSAVGTFVYAMIGAVALLSSVFHLGRPRYFYRAIVGVRHSWLSREVLSFGAFLALAITSGVLGTWTRVGDQASVGGSINEGNLRSAESWAELIGMSVTWSAALAGLFGVYCSAKIYTVTGRATWSGGRVGSLFAGTMVIGGSSLVLACSLGIDALRQSAQVPAARLSLLSAIVIVGVLIKIGAEATLVRHRHVEGHRDGSVIAGIASNSDVGRHAGRRIARLARMELRAPAIGHVVFLVTACLVSSTVYGAGPIGWAGFVAALVLLALIVVAELLERWLFFTMVTRPKVSQ
jgi:formate dehydrogenase iron-sulfur subunit